MKKQYIIIFILMFFTGVSCKKYLDKKPNPSLVIASTLADCQLLLDDYSKMNQSYPSDGEAAGDNYYVTDVNFNSNSDLEVKNNYSWALQAQHILDWNRSYSIIYNANLVLQTLEKITPSGLEYDRIKGSALFFRGFAFYHIAQLFAGPYTLGTAATEPGIPLQLSPDVDSRIERGTLQQTYGRIITDLTNAVTLLPVTTTIQTRPNKTAAYAALARTLLAMENYSGAGDAANSALQLYNSLIDLKTISTIPRFNAEVIFQAIAPLSSSASMLNPTVAKIDTALYNSYAANDKRKSVFFKPNTGANTGTFAFKGSYDGSPGSNIFTGLTTGELYLIRAECAARAGNIAAAMSDLNQLLKYRYDATFVNLTAANADDALRKVLIERRKELVFRNQRWTDIRRLNNDPRFAVTLLRARNSITLIPLAPGDLRYTMLIPLTEISLSGIQRNPR